MSGAPNPFNPRNIVLWAGLLLLAIASGWYVRSLPLAIMASAMGLSCALFLHRFRRDAGHSFVLAHAVLMGGSAILLLTTLAATRPARIFMERWLEKIFLPFFHGFGGFVTFYVICCVILMAFILASQRDR